MIENVECVRCKENVQEPTKVVKAAGPARKKSSSRMVIPVIAAIAVLVAGYFGYGLLTGDAPETPNLLSPASGAARAAARRERRRRDG